MHQASMDAMSMFAKGLEGGPLRVIDVGSRGGRNTYRRFFEGRGHSYFGADIVAGHNVDIVLPAAYNWGMAGEWDVAISGQTLEHVQDVKAWGEEFCGLIRPGGQICLIAPWKWTEHRYPVDCWRILPDGMRWLLQDVGGLVVQEAYLNYNDCIGIASSPPLV